MPAGRRHHDAAAGLVCDDIGERPRENGLRSAQRDEFRIRAGGRKNSLGAGNAEQRDEAAAERFRSVTMMLA